ncbi:MAG: DUF2147 domain-containing protein [Thalassovita sp.]
MRRFFYVLIFVCFAAPLRAEPLIGIWLTKPDFKGQVAHVRAEPCGDTSCGTIIRAFDRKGNAVTTPNVGRRIFWDVAPTDTGQYRGTGWLPLRDRTFEATLNVVNNQLTVKGCLGVICQDQTWTRVQE